MNSDAVAQKLTAMEGGEDSETFASGMAAMSTTLMSLLSSGDHIVAEVHVFSGDGPAEWLSRYLIEYVVRRE